MNSLVPRRDDLFFPIEQRFNQFFSDFFNTKPGDYIKGNAGFPKMNIFESEGYFTVVAAVAGLKVEDLEIEVKGHNSVCIRGKMSSEYNIPNNSQEYVRELRMSSFERLVVLPDRIRGDPDAVLKDGILTLKWKLPEVANSDGKKFVGIRTE